MSRTAIVTGAGTGIGAATARTLAVTCSTVVLVGRRLEKLEQVAAEIAAQHPEVTTHVKSVDLTDVQAVESFASWAIAELTTVDVLVNNAGSVQPRFAGGLQDLSDVWESTIRGNLMSAVLMTEALLPHVTSPGGRIVIDKSSFSGLGLCASDCAHALYIGDYGSLTVTRSRMEGFIVLDYAPRYGEGVQASIYVCMRLRS
jgi:3-oxoacyl-[acyl-carrier protein] reductase